jgi:hypothetical protein
MDFRRFSPTQNSLCVQWFHVVETTDAWTELGPVGEGESQSVRVSNSNGVLGIAKPGPAKGKDKCCRAAHEKLAFDLAHTLGLPVPPVILWADGMPNNYVVGRSISAWAFPQTAKWDEANNQGIITEKLKDSAGPIVSAMQAFHTWISDTDRKSDHVQVDLDSAGDKLGLAFIDHAYSMSHVWKGPDHKAGPCGKYMPAPESPTVIRETCNRIAAFPETQISQLVNRIPLTYLPEPQRGYILQNLISRKTRLQTILAI